MMTAAQTASRARACKRKTGACVARRTIPDKVIAEVDRRLLTDEKPSARKIADDITARGPTWQVGKGKVRERAIFLRIELVATGRPEGAKDKAPRKTPQPSGRPRKKRTNTLFSPLRDEAIRLRKLGYKNAEIARMLSCTPANIDKLLQVVPTEELEPEEN